MGGSGGVWTDMVILIPSSEAGMCWLASPVGTGLA